MFNQTFIFGRLLARLAPLWCALVDHGYELAELDQEDTGDG